MDAIGRYRIKGEIARGGMGVVYHGYDPQLDREVAIKLVLAGKGADETQRRRHMREARALAKLTHPSVVRVRDVGEHAGAPFLVLDLIDGHTIQEQLETQGPLPVEEAVEIAARLADGLAEAHAQGILHRDLKPSNVLLSRGVPILTDFGLAKDQAREQQGQTRQLTQAGRMMGSPGYWAPEQVGGDPTRVGPPTDVYGLGATLYAMLTGRPPIEGGSFVQVVVATTEQVPDPPSVTRPEVSRELDFVVLRCLEKNPSDRYATVEALRDDLERLLRGEAPERSSSRLVLALGVLLVFAVVLAIVLAVVLATRARSTDPEPKPVAKRSATTETPAETAYSRGARLGKAGDLQGAALAFHEAATAGHAIAMYNLGLFYSRGSGVEQSFTQSAKWYRRAVAQEVPEAMVNLGILHERGRGVEPSLAKAVELYRRAVEKGVPVGMVRLGLLHLDGRGVAKNQPEAARLFRRAALAGDASGMTNLATLYLNGQGVARDLATARTWLRKAAAAGSLQGMLGMATLYSRGIGVPKDPVKAAMWYRKAAEGGLPQAMLDLGYAHERGNGVEQSYVEAARWYRKAIAKAQLPAALNNLANLYHRGWGMAQDDGKALELFRQAAEKGHLLAMINVGNLYMYGRGVAKNPKESARWYRKAIAGGERKHAKQYLERLLEAHPELRR